MCSGRLSAFLGILHRFESAIFARFMPTAMSTSLPALLEELHHNLDSVDTTVEAICLVMVRQAVVSNEVPMPIGELAKLCDLLDLARRCVQAIENS